MAGLVKFGPKLWPVVFIYFFLKERNVLTKNKKKERNVNGPGPYRIRNQKRHCKRLNGVKIFVSRSKAQNPNSNCAAFAMLAIRENPLPANQVQECALYINQIQEGQCLQVASFTTQSLFSANSNCNSNLKSAR